MFWQLLSSTLIIVTLYVAALYFGVVRSRQRVKESWSKVGEELKIRHEKIVSLIAVLNGLIDPTELRLKNLLLAIELCKKTKGIRNKEKAEAQLLAALGDFSLILQDNPMLMENAEFIAKADAIVDGEANLHQLRMQYNNAVQRFKNILQSPTSGLIAKLLKLSDPPFFERELMEKINKSYQEHQATLVQETTALSGDAQTNPLAVKNK